MRSALGKISVGPPYFNAVFVPVMTPLLFLMGVGPFARWKEASIGRNRSRTVRWALAAALVVAIALPLVYGNWYAVDRTRPAAGGLDRLYRRRSTSSNASRTRGPANPS